MAADDQISVELIAKIDQLTSGLQQATSAVQAAATAMGEGFHGTGEAAKESEGLMKAVLSGAAFLEFKEIATEALRSVQDAFEATVGQAESFGLSNAKFAAIMGTSEEEAAGLSAALHGVGSSAEEYEKVVIRLEMRVKANEKAMNEMGVATRDSNGHLLAGKDLMDSARAALEQYKAGADQNNAAMAIFGRNTAAVTNMLRVNQEQVDKQIAIYKSYGVNLAGAGSDAAKLEEAENDLHTAWQAQQIVIGQQLMPIMQSFFGWLRDDGKQILDAAKTAVGGLYTTWEAFRVGFVAIVAVVAGGIDSIADGAIMLGKISWDALHLNWDAVKADWKEGTGKIADDVKAAMDTITHEADKAAASIAAFGAKPVPSGGENPFKLPSGNKKFEEPSKGGEKADRGEEEAIAAEERLRDAQVAIEEGFNAHQLAMGRETNAQFIAQAVALENEKFRIKSDALEKQFQVDGLSVVQQAKIYDEIELLGKTHLGALIKIAEERESKEAESARKAIADVRAIDDERLADGMERIDAEYQAGQLTAQKKYQLEVALTQQIRGQEIARLDAELATLTVGTDAYAAATKQRAELVKRYNKEIADDTKKLVAEQQKNVQQWTQPMVSAFTSAFKSMAVQGRSFQDTMKAMMTQLLDGFISMCERIAEKWLVTQITNALIVNTTQTEQTAYQAQGAAADAAISKGKAIAEVNAAAGVAAANAYAAYAAFPPAAAAAAGTAAGAVHAIADPLVFAAGGMVVDRDRLIFAHKDEQVLPAHIAKGLTAIIASGRAGGGSNTTLNYQPTVHGDPKPFAQQLEENSKAMLGWFARQQRSGALRG